jgi:Flp pilus assembly protein protease CpaA
MEIFLIVLALIWILTAIIFDFKTREIPNWLSFSLIIFAFAYRAFASIVNWQDFFTPGLVGFAIFFCLGEIMYRTGFGGGDSKLLVALGPIIPFSNIFHSNILLLVFFFFSLLVLGAGYTLIYSLIIVFKSPKDFWKKFNKEIDEKKKYKLLVFSLIVLSIILIFFNKMFISLLIFFILMPLVFIYSKAVEEMLVKSVSPNKLVPGDWLYENVRLGKKIIKPKITGLDEKDIALLRKYKKKIKVKDGVPFTPSFLLAFALLIYLWYSGWSFFNYYLWL